MSASFSQSHLPRCRVPAEVSAPVAELIGELRDPEPTKRPTLVSVAARLARLLAPHPLFAL